MTQTDSYDYDRVAVVSPGAKPIRVIQDIKTLHPDLLVILKQGKEGWREEDNEFKEHVLDPFLNHDIVNSYRQRDNLRKFYVSSLIDRSSVFSAFFSIAEQYKSSKIYIIATAMPNEAVYVAITLSSILPNVTCYKSGKKTYGEYTKASYGDPNEEGGEVRKIDVMKRDIKLARDANINDGRVFRGVHNLYINKLLMGRETDFAFADDEVPREVVGLVTKAVTGSLTTLEREGLLEQKPLGKRGLSKHAADLATLTRMNDSLKFDDAEKIRTLIEARKDDIERIARTFGHYPSMSVDRVRRFLSQFPTHLTLSAALTMLDHITFIEKEQIEKAAKELYDGITEADKPNTYFTQIGKPANSADIISYYLNHEVKDAHFADLPTITSRNLPCNVIALDDMLISGMQLEGALPEYLGAASSNHATKLTPSQLESLKKDRLRMHFIVGTAEGSSHLQDLMQRYGFEPQVTYTKGLSRKQDSCFDGELGRIMFPIEDNRVRIKREMRDLCRELLSAKVWEQNWTAKQLELNAFGYGNWQLLLVFPHNTPSSTLPIFWSNGLVNIDGAMREWFPLFPRK